MIDILEILDQLPIKSLIEKKAKLIQVSFTGYHTRKIEISIMSFQVTRIYFLIFTSLRSKNAKMNAYLPNCLIQN